MERRWQEVKTSRRQQEQHVESMEGAPLLGASRGHHELGQLESERPPRLRLNQVLPLQARGAQRMGCKELLLRSRGVAG